MKSRIFSIKDQMYLAELSGDWNPLHVDPVASRRSIFGEAVVHGIHLVLWALELKISGENGFVNLKYLKVNFRNPLPLGKTVAYNCNDGKIQLKSDGLIIADISVEYESSLNRFADIDLPSSVPAEKSRLLNWDQAVVAQNELILCLDKNLLAGMFPGLSQRLAGYQIAILLSTSRIVGMHCPGLLSLYSGLELKFTALGEKTGKIRYKVTRADKRISQLILDYQGPDVAGEIKSYLRPPQHANPDMKEILARVKPGEFASQRALVIGGSRGLGEVTVKVIAAGGGEVLFTYFKGSEEAGKIAEDIREHGGTVDFIQYDVSNQVEKLTEWLKLRQWQPTHLYYFATPFIFSKSGDLFSKEGFEMFCNYYVEGFARTLSVIRNLGSGRLVVFYPSSVAVPEDRTSEIVTSMVEYGAAKAAGEALCIYLEKMLTDTSIFSFRLPRMQTDQTVALINIPSVEPLGVILKNIRTLQKHKFPD